MKLSRRILLCLFVTGSLIDASAQEAKVDVNLNIKHSVDGVSDFGRERRMTIHAASNESDWNGHEDMLDYLINDLDVYFGRETGSATWKMLYVEEDPDNPGWANEAQMKEHGGGLNQWYSSADFALRRQFEKKGDMIMGINDFSPMYPNLSWYPGFGKGAGGWFVKDTDAAADWVAKYMKHYFAQSEGDAGPPLPKYWEAYNEPDMNFMNTGFGMIVSSLEKNWEYHKRVAQEVRSTLGDKAPLIGGMTWGQLDLFKPDGVFRSDGQFWYDNSSEEAGLLYDNMLSGVGSGIPNPGIGNGVWPKAWDNRTDQWWQWDFMYQGFIDYAGADMDFYGVHMYDWPNANATTEKANTRAGGHTEAFLDMFEWYDTHLFGDKKDIVLSEFGAVNGNYILSLPNGERDWPFLKSFNQLQMQFLERPSHVVYSMPFAPTKAVWGAHFEGNNVVRYQGATLMEPRGSWTGDPNTWTMNEPTGGWGWSKILYFFELWKGVDGTRVETKSTDNDVQVDAYILNDHAYLILNNTQDFPKTVNLNFFGDDGNKISNVEFRHLFEGDDNIPVLTTAQMTGAPSQVTLKPNATIVLDYTFASNVTINAESKETKYMCEPLAGSATNKRGTQLCHTNSQSSITATINGVVKPNQGEAIIRIGGFFANPSDGTLADGSRGLKVKKLTVNGNEVIINSDNFVANTRGYGVGSWAGSWFGVVELECPVEYLVDGKNTVFFERWQGVQFTTAMIQVFDMTETPGRTTSGSVLTDISFDSSEEDVMEGETLGLVPVYTPADASNKILTWTSSNPSAVTVDENGIVKAVATTGIATITATNTSNGSISATITINAIPFEADDVSAISIDEGDAITLDQYLNTKLNVTMSPAPDVAPKVIWTTSDETIVEIVSPGTIIGKGLGKTARITASVDGTAISDFIDVFVAVAGGEQVFCRELPNEIRPSAESEVKVPVTTMGARSIDFVLKKGEAVIAFGSKSFEAVGSSVQTVAYSLLTQNPVLGTGYVMTVTLRNGDEVLSECSQDVAIIDHIRAQSVSIKEGVRVVKVGESIQLEAEISPSDTYNKVVHWSSSNDQIVGVDENGVVTGAAAGTAVVTATTDDGGLTATVEITSQNEDVAVEVEALILPLRIQLFPGLNYQLELGYVPEWTTQEDVTWTSDNVSIATVNETGLVVAGSAEGIVQITATSVAKPSIKTAVELIVSRTIIVEAEDFVTTGGAFDGWEKSTIGINYNQTGDWGDYQVDIPQTGEYSIIYFIGAPAATTDGKVKFYVNGSLKSTTTVPPGTGWDDYKAINASGTVALSKGIQTIRIESGGTSEWQWNMDRFELSKAGSTNVQSVEVTPESTTIGVNQKRLLTAVVTPQNASDKTLVWSSDNTSVATVNPSTGEITGVSAGVATITATTSDGGFKDSCIVTVQTEQVTILVSEITLAPGSSNVAVGANLQLNATVSPQDADDKTLTWSSSNAAIATVNSTTGMVSGVAEGEVTITAMANDTSGKSATSVISVVTTVAKSIEFDDRDKYLNATYEVGGTIQVSCIFNAGTGKVLDASGVTFWFRQVQSDWAGITKDIKATDVSAAGKSSGTATATISLADVAASTEIGTDFYFLWITITPEGEAMYGIPAGINPITVVAPAAVSVSGVSLAQSTATVVKGQTVSLTHTIAPANASNKNITWKSSDEAIATVNNGVVTGVSAGNVTITVKTVDGGFEATSVITVTDNAVSVTGISLSQTSASLEIGQTLSLTETITPAEATNKSVSWKSNNESVATVSGGVVTAIGAGSATITVTTTDGVKEASCAVIVSPAIIEVSNVLLGISTISVNMGGSFTFAASVLPENATDKTLTWESSNTAVATVANGVVTPVSAGETTITVTSTSNNSKKASCMVTVVGDVVEPLALDADLEKLAIYPIPADKFVLFIGLADGDYNVSIYDLMGVRHVEELRYIREDLQLDVSKLINGIYFVHLNGEGTDTILKIVVKR